MIEKIQNSPFSQKSIFEAVRIEKYFRERGISLEDIKAAKEELTAQRIKELPKPKAVGECPECGGKLYREGVCRNCEKGKEGYRSRLVCENYPECSYDNYLKEG